MVLSGHCTIQVLEIGESVCVDGNALFIVVSGSLQRQMQDCNRLELRARIDEWVAGSVMGETALLTALDPSFIAECTSRAVLVQVPRHVVSIVLVSRPQYVIQISRNVSRTNPLLVQAAMAFQQASGDSAHMTNETTGKLVGAIRSKVMSRDASFKAELGNATMGLSVDPKSQQVCTLIHMFHQFPELGNGNGESCLEIAFFCWKVWVSSLLSLVSSFSPD